MKKIPVEIFTGTLIFMAMFIFFFASAPDLIPNKFYLRQKNKSSTVKVKD